MKKEKLSFLIPWQLFRQRAHIILTQLWPISSASWFFILPSYTPFPTLNRPFLSQREKSFLIIQPPENHVIFPVCGLLQLHWDIGVFFQIKTKPTYNCSWNKNTCITVLVFFCVTKWLSLHYICCFWKLFFFCLKLNWVYGLVLLFWEKRWNYGRILEGREMRMLCFAVESTSLVSWEICGQLLETVSIARKPPESGRSHVWTGIPEKRWSWVTLKLTLNFLSSSCTVMKDTALIFYSHWTHWVAAITNHWFYLGHY